MASKISIIIPTYNRAGYLRKTIESVLKQTHDNLEIIIVDDGSTDTTKEVVTSFQDKKILYFYQDNSGNPGYARNAGIKKSSGDLISFLDSDDIMVPDKLEREVDLYCAHPEVGLIFTDLVKFSESTGEYKESFLSNYRYFQNTSKRDMGKGCYIYKSDDIYEALFHENFIGTSSVVIPRKVISQVGYFDETLVTSEDKDFWFRIARKYDVGYVDMVGHKYRVHESGISRIHPHVFQNRIIALEKQLPLPLSHMLVRQAHREIGRAYSNLAYVLQVEGRMKEARKNFFLSLMNYFRVRPIKGIMVTLVPYPLYSWIRKITRGKTRVQEN